MKYINKYYAVYLLALLLSISAVSSLNASTTEKDFYTLSTTIQPYEDLKSPILIAKEPDEELYEVKIPFKCKIYGQEIDLNYSTGILVYRDGYLVDNKFNGYVIEPFYAFLTSRDSTSTISYEIVGTAPERILKIQWKNMGMTGHSVDDYVNVQLWIFENTSALSFRFGPSRLTSKNGFPTQKGPEMGVLRYDPANGGSFPDRQEMIGDPDNPELVNEVFQYLSGMPKPNMVYTLYPKGVASVQAHLNELAQIKIYPNPSQDKVYIKSNNSNDLQISLLNATGQSVGFQINRYSDEIELDVSSLPRGTYFIRIRYRDAYSYRPLILVD